MVKQAPEGTYVIDDALCIKDRGHVLLVKYNRKELWVPQSVVHEDSEVYAQDHEGRLIVAAWWARNAQLPGAE